MKNKQRVDTWIDDETLLAMRAIQLQTGDSFSDIVRLALSAKIKKHSRSANFTEIRNFLLTSTRNTVNS